MKIVYFTHSLASCWNHGNAHFQRGLLRALSRMGHDVLAVEPEHGWSRRNLMADQGAAPLGRFAAAFPDLPLRTYGEDVHARDDDVAALAGDAGLVIVHEWTEPPLVAALGRLRKRGAAFTLLFHDTHHRAASAPAELDRYDLSGFDGVFAFGEAVAEIYRRRGWSRRVFVLHEAADTSLFRPPPEPAPSRAGLVWVGNWGDAERTEELQSFLLRPARRLGLDLEVHGVRYPDDALALLREHGANYRGWLANIDVPARLARAVATVHVPRRWYSTALPGIPTIRVFEALACGVPLVCAPWEDAEGLFMAGRDYLAARDERAMSEAMRSLIHEPQLRVSLAASGLERIRARHTCRHRAAELMAIVGRLAPRHAMEAR